MSRRRATGLIATLLMIGLAACGSSTRAGRGSDATQIRATVAHYLAALYARDGARACSELTAEFQKEFVERLAESLGAADRLAGKPCAEVLGVVMKAAGARTEDVKPIVDSLKLTNLVVHGNRATMTGVITVNGQSFRRPYEARRVSGRWLVQCCVVSPG